MLTCVAGGIFVAFIWTFISYPLTERSQLRADPGTSLYLLAKFYSNVHETVSIRIKGIGGDLTSKDSPGRTLEKARSKSHANQLALISSLKEHLMFIPWEPTLGGKFPKAAYQNTVTNVEQ